MAKSDRRKAEVARKAKRKAFRHKHGLKSGYARKEDRWFPDRKDGVK